MARSRTPQARGKSPAARGKSPAARAKSPGGASEKCAKSTGGASEKRSELLLILILLLFGLLSFIPTRELPSGSYSGSCQGCALICFNQVLSCGACEDISSVSHLSVLRMHTCGMWQEISNKNGELVCENIEPLRDPLPNLTYTFKKFLVRLNHSISRTSQGGGIFCGGAIRPPDTPDTHFFDVLDDETMRTSKDVLDCNTMRKVEIVKNLTSIFPSYAMTPCPFLNGNEISVTTPQQRNRSS